MKKLLALLVLTTAIPSFADPLENWVYAGGNKDYAAYIKNVERTGDLNWTLWFKVEAKTKNPPFGQATNHTELSCGNKTYKLLAGTTYGKDGRMIADMSSGQTTAWKPLVRGNMIYTVAKELCQTLTPGMHW
jgi:hypothetical protein